MAYARFGGDSDVYVFQSGLGSYHCCCCQLMEDDVDITCETAQEMLGHLDEHREAGHRVPEDALERLKEDFDTD